MNGRAFLSLYLCAAAGSLLVLAASQAQHKKDILKIGVSGKLADHLDQDTVKEGLKSLRSLVETETGHPTEVGLEPDWQTLLAELKANKRNLAGLCGFEYAWASARDPRLKPLMIIINEKPLMFTHVLVKKDSAAAQLADLAGKSLALPRGSRAHCRIYLDRQAEKVGGKSIDQFVKLASPPNSEDALDDVVDGLADAVAVEEVAVEAYARRKPGRFAQLKEIFKSEPFPATVVAYYEGGLDQPTLERFREGMLNLNDTVEGRRVLTLWRQTAFQNVPQDYARTTAAMLKLYPEKK
jgi:ABC-type phosphate/phosphonate transport system substrate-binding protein